MKEELIEIINSQNDLLGGILLTQPAEKYVDEILENAHIVTYTAKGSITGFIAYYCNDPRKEVAFLTMLCIAPQFSGNGLGRLLLNTSIKDITRRGFIAYELELHESNTSAQKMYASAGFEIIHHTGGVMRMKKYLNRDA